MNKNGIAIARESKNIYCQYLAHVIATIDQDYIPQQ